MAYGLTQSVDFERTSSQYASITDNTSLSITGDLTGEGHFRLEQNIGMTFFAKNTASNNERGYWFYYESNLLYYLTSSVGNSWTSKTVSWTPTTDTWYHLACVYTASAGSVSFYVDGVQQGTTQTGLPTSQVNTTTPFMLGGRNLPGGATDLWDGQMSLVRIWSVARSQSDISTNMCNVLGATTGLQAEWKLDGDYTDNSGNGNTLTATNSPTFAANLPSTCSGGAVNTTNFFHMM